MWIKICGLTDETGVEAALEARVDAVGFVLFPPSPRHIPFDHAATLAERVRGKADIVALTVNAEDAFLDDLVGTLNPDILQFHGEEPQARVASVKARTGLPVMKALAVAEADDLNAIADYRDRADRILLDAKPPRDATRPGGNGAAFDWSLLGHVAPNLGYVLSGGLTPENVTRALSMAKASGRMPWGVDVSSGVEDAPGMKNALKIACFVAAVRDTAAHKSETLAVTQPA